MNDENTGKLIEHLPAILTALTALAVAVLGFFKSRTAEKKASEAKEASARVENQLRKM